MAAAANEIGHRGQRRLRDEADTITELRPERDAEFCAGAHQAEERISAVAAGVAAGAAADFALDDVAADVTLRAVGVQWNVRPVEHHQQFGLVGKQPFEQAIQGGEPGAAREDAIGTGSHLAASLGRRRGAERLEIGVEPPDQRADALLCGAMKGGERVEPMHQPFGMHPAQRVLTDVELTGIIADNHRLAQEAVVRHATPQRAFGGDAQGSGVTCNASIPRRRRWAFQAVWSSKRVRGSAARRQSTDPESERERM